MFAERRRVVSNSAVLLFQSHEVNRIGDIPMGRRVPRTQRCQFMDMRPWTTPRMHTSGPALFFVREGGTAKRLDRPGFDNDRSI